jgi:hypothetical protein
MEQLRIKADRFKKQGRLQDEDVEEIIKEIKEKDQITNEEEGRREESTRDKQQQVLEAVQEGLQQIHGSAPNTEELGIFWIMGKYHNGFNNRIGGNKKIVKALDIKEDLDIDCLMYCKHWINFRHKDNKNALKQMFQRESACTAVSAHNVHKDKHAGQVQEGGTGIICFGECTGYIKKVGQEEAGLRRWSWILMGGTTGRNTRIITRTTHARLKTSTQVPPISNNVGILYYKRLKCHRRRRHRRRRCRCVP